MRATTSFVETPDKSRHRHGDAHLLPSQMQQIVTNLVTVETQLGVLNRELIELSLVSMFLLAIEQFTCSRLISKCSEDEAVASLHT